MARKPKYQIPFNPETGNMVNYDLSWKQAMEWRDIYTFEATLKYYTYERGRSAAVFWWEDEKGHKYPMFISYLDILLSAGDITDGFVHGKWTFIKKGANYSIMPVREEVTE